MAIRLLLASAAGEIAGIRTQYLSHSGNGDATVRHSECYTTCKASLVSAEMASESRSAMAMQTSCGLQSATHTMKRYKMMK
jgi:hypothetical protein